MLFPIGMPTQAADGWPHLAMHEQPNGEGDIEPAFNHSGVHNCYNSRQYKTGVFGLRDGSEQYETNGTLYTGGE